MRQKSLLVAGFAPLVLFAFEKVLLDQGSAKILASTRTLSRTTAAATRDGTQSRLLALLGKQIAEVFIHKDI